VSKYNTFHFLNVYTKYPLIEYIYAKQMYFY